MAYNSNGVFEATDQQSIGFITSEAARIESRMRQEMLAKVKYPELVYVDTEVMGVADDSLITYIGRPGTGRMTPLANGAMDLPMVDVQYDRINREAYSSGIAYGWDDMEVERANLVRRPLQSDRVRAAFEVAEREKEDVVLNGKSEYGWSGLITNTATGVEEVAATASWATDTSYNAYSTIKKAFNKIFKDTNQVIMPDTLLLPVNAGTFLFEPLQKTDGGITTMSVYKYLTENNPYTMMTGQPLRIIMVNELDTAGTGGTPLGLMYSSSQDAGRFIIAQDLTFIGPQREAFTQKFYGRMKLGGFQVLQPKAYVKITGIGDAS